MQVATWTLPLTDDSRRHLLEAVLAKLCGNISFEDRAWFERLRNVLQANADALEHTKLEWAWIDDCLNQWIADEPGARREAASTVAALDAMYTRKPDGSREVEAADVKRKQAQPSLF